MFLEVSTMLQLTLNVVYKFMKSIPAQFTKSLQTKKWTFIFDTIITSNIRFILFRELPNDTLYKPYLLYINNYKKEITIYKNKNKILNIEYHTFSDTIKLVNEEKIGQGRWILF